MYFFTPGHGWGGPDVVPRFFVALSILAIFAVIPAIVGAVFGFLLNLIFNDPHER